MKLNNKKRAVKYRRIFFLGSVAMAIAALAFFFMDMLGGALLSVGVFSLWYLYFHVADYQIIEFSTENNRIVLRYYKAISFGGVKFNEIDFQQNMLRKALFENSVFGKLTDLTLVVRTKRGAAEYPTVSLSALAFEDRKKIAHSLNELL